jgi:glucose/arabinose dehydrogenase/mono/diheme cytochrome c family protein
MVINDFQRLVWLCALLFFGTPWSLGQEDADETEDSPTAAGLVATYVDADQRRIQRVDELISFDWKLASPDPRIGVSEFSVTWRGFLFARSSGNYRISALVAGHLDIDLLGKRILDVKSRQTTWVDSRPMELSYGWHPITIQFAKAAPSARVSILWSGPDFPTEPVTSWFHHATDFDDDGFRSARRAVRAMRCAACHDLPTREVPQPAPALDRLAGNLSRDWLVDMLARGHAGRELAPRLSIALRDAASMATALLGTMRQPPEPQSKNSQEQSRRGEELFMSVGCLACHKVGSLGSDDMLSGGDLSDVGGKRPTDFFQRWLTDPDQINRHRRMPVFALTDEERADLAAYLSTRVIPAVPPAPDDRVGNPYSTAEPDSAAATLIEQYRCTACHQLDPPLQHSIARSSISAGSRWSRSCIESADLAPFQPRFVVSDELRRQIVNFFSSTFSGSRAPLPAADGADLLAEHRCFSCHARGTSRGIAPVVDTVTAAFPKLNKEIAALIPPALDGIGDKLTDSAFQSAVSRSSSPRRSWLRVRMPRFDLSDREVHAIATHFQTLDRLPDPGTEPIRTAVPEPQMVIAGGRLVTADGFGCTSCHQIGKLVPDRTPVHLRGPDLSQLAARIREPWFYRWVRNPARIIPRVEMPAVQRPVLGVLHDDLADQLAAVWHVLNRDDFQPPEPDALRVVRQSGLDERDAMRAHVLTDVLHIDRHTLIKPLIVGLPNRHNVAFDLADNRLVAWSIGDVARQRTSGKSWFWEWAGVNVLGYPTTATATDFAIEHDGRVFLPRRRGQFVTEADTWRHLPAGGLEFQQRVLFDLDGIGQTIVHVTQVIEAGQSADGRHGFRRAMAIRGVPAGTKLVMNLCSDLTLETASDRPDAVYFRSHDFDVVVSITRPAGATIASGRVTIAAPATHDQTLELDARYMALVPADTFAAAPGPTGKIPPAELDIVPGYSATRLGVPDQLMPTGLAWRPDGTLVVSSLEGRVWLITDTDGDGCEDNARPFSDELAAPYGVATEGLAVDVITKYALLRLQDENGNGRADRTITLASGWGHTDDYHDWTMGLPRDPAGNYIVATACQQDDRSAEAAHLRGFVLRLTPREPTPDDPRSYSIEPISGGHRFPMGIARSSGGELFVTDNQGNYNPFNELNHVRPGARYGFVNELEKAIESALPAATPPAINIPHPWTRSVNGICFLDDPDGRQRFGPLEGHLIGCEYDTRQLVRLSLQKVGDHYQGAVYPFTSPEGSERLVGPVSCAISPRGELYVGELRDRGWGAGNNRGGIVRLRAAAGALPAGIAEVRAMHDGFVIDFTRPVSRSRAGKASHYHVSSFTRIATPAYGADDRDRRVEKIQSVEVSADNKQVRLRLEGLRRGYVYEFHLDSLAEDQGRFFPAEAYYTLSQIP